MSATPVLRARLALPAGDLEVPAGGVATLPDDPRYVEALAGTDGRADHRIEVAGRRVDRRAPARRVRAGLVVVGDDEVAEDVTVLDHLAAIVAPELGRARLEATPWLRGRAGEPAGVLSGGERRLLGWLLADLLRPRVAVLDRAGTGLDPDALQWAHHLLDGWLDAGAAVVARIGRPEERGWLVSCVDGAPRRVQ